MFSFSDNLCLFLKNKHFETFDPRKYTPPPPPPTHTHTHSFNCAFLALKAHLKGNCHQKKVLFLSFYNDSRLEMMNFKKVIKLFVFQLRRHTGTPRKCTDLCSLSDKEGILRTKGHGDVKLTWYTLWDNQMILEDFRSFHRICDVTGSKKGEKVPKWSKTPYLDSSMSQRCKTCMVGT